MAEELVPGGEKDSVVYLGKSSFKMKVGVRTTPAAETSLAVPQSPRVTQTPPSHVTPPPVKTSSHVTPSHVTPPPVRTSSPPRSSRAPSPQSGAHSRPAVAPESQLVGGLALAKSTLVGLCLTAFSCGIMCTVAVDRYWPRARAECVGAQPGTTHAVAAPAAPVIEAPARAEAVPAAGVAEVMPLPPYEQKLPAVVAAAVEVAHTPPPAPALAAAPATRARPVTAGSPPPALRGPAVPGRTAPAQGRAVVRKRPVPATVAADKPPAASPTETWTDPFAQ